MTTRIGSASDASRNAFKVELDAGRVREPAAITGDDMLDGLRQIIVAAQTLTDRLQQRVPGMEGQALAPFALHQLMSAGRRGLPQVEVARMLRMSPSSATRLIDSLETHGLVRREAHPNDRRINQVVLTVVGKAVVQDLTSHVERRSEELGLRDRSAIRTLMTDLATMVASVQ